MKKIHKIYQMFLEHPHLNACLVFNSNEFQGILLKKDLEQNLYRTKNDISKLIIKMQTEHIEDILFHDPPNIKTKIPYINPSGKLMGVMLYEEFVSEFFTEDLVTKISYKELLDYYEHPVVILNQFKTILYLNKLADELLSEKVFGMKISDALLAFDIEFDDDRMILRRQDEAWSLFIAKSKTPYTKYYFYHFMPYK